MRIKNILFALSVWAAAAGVVSCDKFEPLLDIKQDGAISFSNMWQDANDVVTSTNGIYYRLRSCFVQDECNVFYWGEARVGEYMWGPGLDAKATDANKRAVLLSNMTGATGSCSWSALYTAIDQANSVIKYAPKVDMDQAQRDYCLGQAYFARAYCYFWAARLWGDVPLNLLPVEGTNQPETYPERAPKAEVYERIGLDIEEAQARAAQLGSDAYFATAAAVNLLDAEYSLWMYSTQNGGDAFLDRAGSALGAMGLNRSRLSDNYSDVFDRTKKKGKEVIFALRNDQTEKLTGGYYFYFYHPTSAIDGKYVNNPVPAYKTQWWSYSQNFVDILQASRKDHGDKRVSTNLGIGSYGSGDGRTLSWPNKFLGEMTGSLVILDADLLYYRYAEAIMLDAELKYYRKDYDGALASLNIIADRAYGKAIYTSATRDDVLRALCNEYFLEFPAEGVIWWALIRLGKIWDYNPSLKAKEASNPNILLWPLTNSAINRNNKIKQTEGWS